MVSWLLKMHDYNKSHFEFLDHKEQDRNER